MTYSLYAILTLLTYTGEHNNCPVLPVFPFLEEAIRSPRNFSMKSAFEEM